MKILFLIFSLISFCFAQTPTDVFTTNPILSTSLVVAALIWYIRNLEAKNEAKQKEINEVHRINHDSNAAKIQELESYIKNEFLKVIEKNNNLIEKFLEKLDKDENK